MDVNKPSKYKFINFVKETTDQSNVDLDGNEIKQFYEDLISESSILDANLESKPSISETIEDERMPVEPQTNQQKLTDLELRNLEKEFLKAAQTGDIKTIEKYIENDYDINILDSYKWSALMIAVASQNFDIVKLLLENNADVTVEDNAGNNAYKLAAKLKNNEIRDLIVQIALANDDDEGEITDEEEDMIDENVMEHCEICDKAYSKRHEKSHFTSIVHIINENKGEKLPNIVSYGLKNTNKGYQMLVKSGWNESTGLGSQEQGRIYPIRVKKKEDRYGIGVDKKKFRLKTTLFGYNDAKQESKPVFKSLKDLKKTDEKMKKFERNFRQYFDS